MSRAECIQRHGGNPATHDAENAAYASSLEFALLGAVLWAETRAADMVALLPR